MAALGSFGITKKLSFSFGPMAETSKQVQFLSVALSVANSEEYSLANLSPFIAYGGIYNQNKNNRQKNK